ncbi:type I-F CRISPR-associated protein Csy1, partial [Desulfobacterota bacterium M19]
GNASQLNGKRGGKLALFCSQPPIWEGQLKPPINQSSFLYAGLNYHKVKEPIDFLRDFLIRFEKINLSTKDPKKKKWIDGWVNNIIDEIFLYAACIQNLPPGWSNYRNIKLKLEHRYFLDPHRDDEDFQKLRQSTDWQTVVCSDFANWLNGRLKGKDKKFTPQREHTQMWKKLMEKELREHVQLIEVDRKFQNEGQQA